MHIVCRSRCARMAAFSLVLLWLTATVIHAQSVEEPPNIYKWIEENAHICTSIPSNGENLINFLTPSEGAKCSLCPDHNPRSLPVSACAVELSPNEIDVDIGCHPIPELCILELKTRYAEFFSVSQRSPRPDKPEEDIFKATSNPFSPSSNQLGRSSFIQKPKSLKLTVAKSNVFVDSVAPHSTVGTEPATSSQSSTTTIATTTTTTLPITTPTTTSTTTTTTTPRSTTTQPTTTTTTMSTTTTRATTTTTTPITTIIRTTPPNSTTSTASTTTTRKTEPPPTPKTSTTTTLPPTPQFIPLSDVTVTPSARFLSNFSNPAPFVPNGVLSEAPDPFRPQEGVFPTLGPEILKETTLEVDSESGTTIRADVFSSPSGVTMVPLVINPNDIAVHARVAEVMNANPLNKEVMPELMPKYGYKATVEKRVTARPSMPDPVINSTSTLPTTTTSSTTTRTPTSATPPTTTVTLSATVNGSWSSPGPMKEMPRAMTNGPGSTATTTLMTTTTTPVMTTTKKECKDMHKLCCFWAIAGECDSNPFWMRIHCAKTCGTCNCSLNEADQCVSVGISCEIPTTTTTTTTPVPTTRPTTPTTTPSTTSPSTETTKSFGRFTARPRQKLPSWKQRPLPPAPPSPRPEVEEVIDRGQPAARPPFDRTLERGGDFAISSGGGYGGVSLRPHTLQPPPRTSDNSLLSTTGATCFDYNQLCSFWADLDECQKNPFWMRPNCQRSCQSCGESVEDVFAPEAKPGCTNLHQLCPFWAFIGECARNPRWMLKHCRPSCQVC